MNRSRFRIAEPLQAAKRIGPWLLGACKYAKLDCLAAANVYSDGLPNARPSDDLHGTGVPPSPH
jgi:hypothetical protein